VRRLVASELRKLFTTRLWLWMLLASVALTGLFTSLIIAFRHSPQSPVLPMSTPGGQRALLEVGAGAEPLIAVLAAIGFTGELRHKTATFTFLATPQRARVLLAKVAAYGLAGMGYALVLIAVTLAIALPWLSAEGIDVHIGSHHILAALAGVVAAFLLFAVMGVGVGALVGDQTAAVVGLLVFLFVVGPALTSISALHGWSIYLPGAAADGLTQWSQAHHRLLRPWQGGLVLTAYAAVLATIGTLAVCRRDVT
jgi:ABC-2 type transport system permease protein